MSDAVKVPRLLTVAQLEKETGVARWRWYSMLAEGKGPPALRIGRTYRVSEAALVAWIESQHNNN